MPRAMILYLNTIHKMQIILHCNLFMDCWRINKKIIIRHYNIILLQYIWGILHLTEYIILATTPNMQNYDQAIKWQSAALQMDDTNYVSHVNYARLLGDVHRYDDATKAWQNAIALRSDLVDLRIEFAIFLMDIKQDYLLAAAELNTAHKLSRTIQK